MVEARSDREFLIIDGQQRLATLSILALAVIARLRGIASCGVEPDANRERAQELRNRFIGEKDPASLTESSRLYLNETDNGFYQDYLAPLREPLNPRRLPRSTALLWECFRYFSGRIADLQELGRDGQAVARLLSETVARQLLFILITVDDELNAYTVFETLNSRRLELTTTDLWRDAFDPDRWEETAYRLGNLTLLERTANRTIGNAAYADKAAAYARSRYALSRRIPEDAPEQWTPALLDARQNRMAARAAHLWRSDFP